VPERKGVLLRLDPAVHDALAHWAADELRSTNAQIDYLLRAALSEAGRLPRNAKAARPRGRPEPTSDQRIHSGTSSLAVQQQNGLADLLFLLYRQRRALVWSPSDPGPPADHVSHRSQRVPAPARSRSPKQHYRTVPTNGQRPHQRRPGRARPVP